LAAANAFIAFGSLLAGGQQQAVKRLWRGNRKDRRVDHRASATHDRRRRDQQSHATHAHRRVGCIRIGRAEVEAAEGRIAAAARKPGARELCAVAVRLEDAVKQMPLA
jgi:hypothetical protein